jgi:L-alanine-DL-glutamate epimerase-like enolase superfamily enzyme
MSIVSEVELIEFDHTVVHRYDRRGEPLNDASPAGRTTRRFGVRIRTDDGAVGEYVVLWSAPPYAIAQVKAMAASLVGRDVHDREAIWDRLNGGFAKTDRIGAGALDIALWDVAGKLAGLGVSQLLGRFRDRLPAYVSTVGGGHGLGTLASADSYRDFADECAQRGVPGFKIHGRSAGTAQDEIEIFGATAEGSAGRTDIMTDPGKSLPTLAAALKLGRFCDEVGAFWWEDPMRGDAPLAHRILRERVRTPLLITEFVRGLELRTALALDGATDFLRADPELDVGITGVMKTAHAAEALGLDLEVHAAGPAQRHCMAAIRNTSYYELGLLDPTTGNPLLPEVFADGYADDLSAVGDDGCVGVPSGPGLGVTYDWDRIATMNVDRTVFH